MPAEWTRFNMWRRLLRFLAAFRASETAPTIGGEASPEEYAAALASVSTALRTAGRQPVAAEAECDPDHLCFPEVLQANECQAAAVVTYWAQSESRAVPHIVITLADTTGLVAEDIAPTAATGGTLSAYMRRTRLTLTMLVSRSATLASKVGQRGFISALALFAQLVPYLGRVPADGS